MKARFIRQFLPPADALKTGTLRLTSAGKWMSYFVLIGLIAGLGSIAFNYLCQLGTHFFLDQIAGYRPPAPAGEPPLMSASATPFNRWLLLLLPAFGGLLSGWLVYTFAPEAEGHGTDAAIDAFHNKGGYIRGRIPFIKTIASALTITTGGSGGREGPIAQIGAGFGSFLGRRLKLSARERRIMLAAGMAAGIGSIFRAPLAGALFDAEVLYRDPEFEAEVIIPAGISSIVAYCLFCLVFGWGSLFHSQDFVFRNPLELGPYTVLAFIVVGAGILYIKSFYGLQRFFKSLKIPNHLKPAIGGLCTGIIGYFLPQTLSFGYGFAQMALANQLPTLFLLCLAFGKIFTTSFSIGSGGSGGVFGPSIVIGGALGGAVGRIFNTLMPQVVSQPGAFVIVGMAGFFAAVSNAPISTIIFVSEMTNSYHLLLPSLLVCSLAYLLSRKWTIYVRQAKNRIESNAHRGDFFVDVLGRIRVKELMPRLRKVRLIPQDMSLKEFSAVFRDSDQDYFPVVDEDKRLAGIFSINDIRSVILDQEIGELILMKDVAYPDLVFTTPSEDLNEVLKKFTLRNLHSLPVVKDDDHAVLLGVLDRREVIAYYNERVQTIKSLQEPSGEGLAREIVRLRNTRVADALNPHVRTVAAALPLAEIRRVFDRQRFHSFPVVAEGRLVGILSLTDVEKSLQEGKGAAGLTAAEICTRQIATVSPEDTLITALSRISHGDFAILPVVDARDRQRLTGVISRRDIISALSLAILEKDAVEAAAPARR